MNKFNTAMRAALVVAFGAALTVSALAADTTAAPTSNPKAAHADFKQEMEKRRQEFFKHMTERMADRLEIKASQQSAWQAYTKALETAMTPPAQHAEYKSDAASIARMNADHAAEHARRLAQIADATAKFQDVLSPDQRKTFDQMAAAFMHRHHGMHHHGRGGFGGHDGGDGHEHRGWGHDGDHQGDHQGQGGQGGQWDHHDGGQHGGAN